MVDRRFFAYQFGGDAVQMVQERRTQRMDKGFVGVCFTDTAASFRRGFAFRVSLRANFFSSIIAAFMYFATLTEVPILQGLIGSGMGKGPALALLLAGPALSLPSMLVIRSVIGTKKTAVYVGLVVIMATASGMIFGIMVR